MVGFLIPFIFLFTVIIVSHVKFKEDHESTKIAILVSLIIGLLGFWSYSLTISPQIHPNLLDISFIITIFIAIFSIIQLSNLQKWRVFYPFLVSLIFLIIQFWSKNFADLFLKIAIIFPIISFAVEFPSIATILIGYPLLLLRKGGLAGTILVFWIFRLLSLVLLFNIIRNTFRERLRIRNSFINKFLSNYLSFFILWNLFTLLIFLVKKEIEPVVLLNYILLLPAAISLLLMFQEKFLKRDHS